MIALRAFLVVCCLAGTAAGDTYILILKGKVVMQDGSPPPKTVSVERHCSDSAGSAPGPLANRKGEYVWRMEVDPLRTRSCVLRSSYPGYNSSQIDISGFNSYTDPNLPPLVLTPQAGDSNLIVTTDVGVPSRAMKEWKAATKALDAGDLAETVRQLQAAVQAAPKFTQGWNTLGLVYYHLQKPAEARDAFGHAIESDPKALPAYLSMARLCIKTKDWPEAMKTADALIKADTKKQYPEIYLHQAVARYGLKDLDGAEASAKQAIRLDLVHKRSEYVLGRILAAKGDLGSAREHISKYLELDPNASDVELIRAHLQNLGKAEAAGVEPDLELP